MLITNFRLKYVLYKIVCGAYQLVDTGWIHPVRERALRALQRSVDYVESAMPDALGFDSQRELIDYSLQAVAIDGHYLYSIDDLRSDLLRHQRGARLAIRYRHGRLTYDNYLVLASNSGPSVR